MRAFLRLFLVCGVLGFRFNSLQAAPVATNPPTGFRLIVELRDGSKIIGKNGDDNFQFRSDVLGEMKLPLERIRSIACPPKTNSVQLTTANGDTLTAQFVTQVVHVETAFGNFKLPVNLIRHLTVSPAGKPGQTREGLVALWPGEGNANDIVGINNGVAQNIAYANGEVGQAFVFNGSGSSCIRIPASPALNVGQSHGFTFELWCNPATTNSSGAGVMTLAEWNGNSGELTDIGCHLEFYNGGIILADIVDPTTGNDHFVQSPGGNVEPNHWQHVAMTYDKTTGVLTLYRNGVVAAHGNVGIWTPSTAFDLYFGKRSAGVFAPIPYQGLLDEISLYNRDLSAAEIQADYEAGGSY